MFQVCFTYVSVAFYVKIVYYQHVKMISRIETETLISLVVLKRFVSILETKSVSRIETLIL